MADYKMIAVDMDGTLLTSDKTIGSDTIRDINAAIDAGVQVVYCTGRGMPELEDYMKILPRIRYAIGISGALVYDIYERRIISSRAIEKKYYSPLFQAAREHDDAMIQLMTEDRVIMQDGYGTQMKDFNLGQYQSLVDSHGTIVPDIEEAANACNQILKINLHFRSAAARDAAYIALKGLPLEMAYCEDSSLEINAEGVTKARGLLELSKYLGIPMESIIGIGDSDNDKAMLLMAGLSVAMANASPPIAEICNEITIHDNDHNGVGEVIKKYILGDGDR